MKPIQIWIMSIGFTSAVLAAIRLQSCDVYSQRTILADKLSTAELKLVRGGTCFRTEFIDCPPCGGGCNSYNPLDPPEGDQKYCHLPNPNVPDEWVCRHATRLDEYMHEYGTCFSAVTGNLTCLDQEPLPCCVEYSCTSDWCEMDSQGIWLCPENATDWSGYVDPQQSYEGPCPEG